jgi:hypothetical protein
MTFATGADVADNRMPNGQTPNRHHPDLAACKTWPGGEPLTQADKSKLMDVIQTAGQHGVGPALHGGLKVMMDQGKADGWQAVAPMLKILEDQNAIRNRRVRDLCLRINTILRSADITPVFPEGVRFHR